MLQGHQPYTTFRGELEALQQSGFPKGLISMDLGPSSLKARDRDWSGARDKKNFSIGFRVGDLHVVGLGLGLLRGLVSHVLVLLTDSVHVDDRAAFLDRGE